MTLTTDHPDVATIRDDVIAQMLGAIDDDDQHHAIEQALVASGLRWKCQPGCGWVNAPEDQLCDHCGAMPVRPCTECGEPFQVDATGTARHLAPHGDGEVDLAADLDHEAHEVPR